MPKRNKILVVMPSRGRPVQLLEAAASILGTAIGYTDLLVIVDRHDPQRLEVDGPHVRTLIMEERLPVAYMMNQAILPLADDYDIFGLTGDDVRYRTEGWDMVVWNILKHRFGIVYGNDSIQCDNLPTHPWISAGIIKAVGFVTPPCLDHYFWDNYFKAVGLALGSLHYRPDLLTPHLHHSVRLGLPYDQVYKDGELVYEADRANFTTYVNARMPDDIKKIIAAEAEARPGSHTRLA